MKSRTHNIGKITKVRMNNRTDSISKISKILKIVVISSLITKST